MLKIYEQNTSFIELSSQHEILIITSALVNMQGAMARNLQMYSQKDALMCNQNQVQIRSIHLKLALQQIGLKCRLGGKQYYHQNEHWEDYIVILKTELQINLTNLWMRPELLPWD